MRYESTLASVRMIVCLWLMAVALFAGPAGDAQTPLDVSGPARFKVLEAAQVADADGVRLSLDGARAMAAAGELLSAQDAVCDPACEALHGDKMVYGPVWARLLVTNGSDREIAARLDTRAGILNNVLVAHLVRGNGEATLIWRNDWLEEPYTQQFPKSRLRASAAFSLQPSEQVEVWVDYPLGFDLGEELWLANEVEFVARRTGDAGYSAFFFGWRAALIIAVFAFAIVLRSKVAAYYGLFSIALFAFFLENYGFTYTYLFRSHQADQAWYVASGGLAFIFFGLMCLEFLSASRLYPKFNRAMKWTMIAGCGFGVLATLAGPFVLSFVFLVPVVLTFVSLCLYGAFLGVRNHHGGAVLYLVATVMLFANCLFGMFSWPPLLLIPAQVNIDVTHLGFSLDAFLFAGALVTQALTLRRERDQAHDAKVAALTEKAELTRRVTSLAADHERALALAETRRRALAETSHDLKQPLLSLQMSLRNREDVDAVSKGISYLQSVVDKTLVDARPSGSAEAPKTPRLVIDRSVPLETIFANVTTMFGDEAAQKGIQLKVVPTSVRVIGEPVILMRILINLVANAIKHTESGRVLIGARPSGETVSIEVHDTGPGMDVELRSRIFEPYVAGEGSTGEGIGLSVVKELAETNGWSVSVRSNPGRGATFKIAGIERLGQNT